MKFESFPAAEPAPEEPQPKPISPDQPRENDPESKKTEWSKRVDEIYAEEVAKTKTEIIQQVTRGLGDLFELCPKNREITKKDLVELIEHTELRLMLPGMREKLADNIIKTNTHRLENKAQFIGSALDTEAIKIYIDLEAGKAASDDILDRLRQERGGDRLPPAEA